MNDTKGNRGAGDAAARTNDLDGLIVQSNSRPPELNQAPFRQDRIDPRLAFLARAGARLILVEEGLMSLDEAVDAPFVDQFNHIAGRRKYQTMQRIEVAHRRIRRQWPRKARR